MTDLTKPVTRRATLLTDNRIQVRSRDKVVVTLYPDLTIGFRPHKCRQEARLPLSTVYILAQREADKARRLEKKKTRLMKRSGLL